MLPKDKALLRKKILSQRKSLAAEEFRARNRQICDRIRAWKIFCEAKTVLAYFSFRQEPDLSSLITNEKRWGFPSCRGNDLLWHAWQPGAELKAGKYGIQEPLNKESAISITEVDLVIVPTVACDRLGYRLGYGGGYYDRLLAAPQWHNCTTLGVVFNFAYVDRLPRETWDIKLKYICSEFGLDKYQD